MRHNNRSIRLVITAAVAALFAPYATNLTSAATATWLFPISGSWNNTSEWSSSPYYPNNGNPAGTTYDVTINTPGSPYTVQLTSSVSVDSFTLNSPSATLVDTSGTFTASQGINVLAGAFNLAGATIANTTVHTDPGATFNITAGVLSSTTLDGQFTSSHVAVSGDLTLTPGSTLTTNSTATGPDLLFLSGPHTLSGGGTIALSNDSLGLQQSVGNTPSSLTIAPDATVTVSAGAGSIDSFQYLANGTLINQGTLWSSTPNTTLGIDTQWTNQGILKLTAGTLALGGAFTTAGIGTLQRTGGTLVISGALDNANAIIALNAANGSWNLSNGGSITGGSITTSQGSSFHVTYEGLNPSFTLKDVSVDTDLYVDSGASLLLVGSANFTPGHTLYLTGSSISFQSDPFSGQALFQGASTGSFGPNGAEIGADGAVRTGTGSGYVGGISTQGNPWSITNYGLISAETPGKKISINPGRYTIGKFTNNATIQAINGTTLELGGSWTNNGTILVDHSTLILGGVFSTSGIGTLNASSATVQLNGLLNNTGSNLVLSPDFFGSLTVTSFGEISGGTVTTTGGSQLIIGDLSSYTGNPRIPVLSGVTLAGDAVITGPAPYGISIDYGLHLNNSTLRFTGSNSLLVNLGQNANPVVDGTGQIIFDGGGSYTLAPGLTAGMTFGPGISISTASGGGIVGGGTLPLLIQGSVLAQNPNHPLTLAGSLTNTGTITASNGGSLSLTGPLTTAGLGSFTSLTGQVLLQGPLDNSDPSHPLTLSASTGSLYLSNNASISGGDIDSPDSTPLIAFSGVSTLTSVNLLTDVSIRNGATLQLASGTTAESHTFSLASTGNTTSLKLLANVPLPANSVVSFDGTSSSNVLSPTTGSPLLIPLTTVVRTGIGSGTVGISSAGLTNSGLISAQTSGQSLTLTGSNWSNLGTLQSLNGSTLNLAGTFTPPSIGTVITDGSPVNITGSLNANSTPLALSASLPLGLAGGTITGTINSPDSTPLIVRAFSGGTLSAATVNAPVSVLVDAVLTASANTSFTQPVVLNSATLNLKTPWSNSSTITANAGSYIVLSATPPTSISNIFLNYSHLQITGSSYTTASIRPISFTDSTIVIPNLATLDNSNDTLSLSSDAASLTLQGGTLKGGTVTASTNDPTIVTAAATTSTLNAVTFAVSATVTSGSTLTIQSGLTLNNSHISVQGNATLLFSGPSTLSGSSGDISFDSGSSGAASILPSSPTSSLTITPNITIHTGSGNGAVGTSSRASLILQGAISAQTPAKEITLLASSITNTGSLSASNSSTLLIDATSFTNTGSITIAPSSTLILTNTAASSPLGSLSLSGTALLNYSSTSPIDSILQQISAHTITTPLPNAAIAYSEASQLLGLTGSQTALYAGHSVDATTLILLSTLPGDANLDGKINADDYALLDKNYAKQISNPRWTNGDFNYDGIIDQQDYLLIDRSLYQAQGFSPGFLAQRESEFGSTYVTQLLTSLPEPSLILLPTLCLFRRACRPYPKT
ncbi:MAG TPA: dockerin type I repeat-containing protein [Tepidisphaeraceae bacterium]|jgi:filamentous hemagglutinin|nr:dockerin type I repeat-containing protein [Tepidisphaeraceae bacterium]